MADEGSQTGSPEGKTDKSLIPGDAGLGSAAPRDAEATVPSGSGVEPGTPVKPDKKV